MRAQTSLLAFANRGYSIGRVVERPGTRHDATARRRGLGPRVGIPRPGQQSDSATSILVASVESVQRKLGGCVILDAVEMACAETYRQPADRERFIAARMLLRHALSKAVGGRVAPQDWKYREGAYGKPTMAAGLPPLEFNVSHSGGCVAVGVSMKTPIGIDIECIDPNQPAGIVYDVLTEVERDRLREYPADRQWAQFIRIWTAKEACSKALGLGLSLDFQRIEVQFDPLCVRLLDHSASATGFEVAATTIARNGRPYSLSIARIVDKQDNA